MCPSDRVAEGSSQESGLGPASSSQYSHPELSLLLPITQCLFHQLIYFWKVMATNLLVHQCEMSFSSGTYLWSSILFPSYQFMGLISTTLLNGGFEIRYRPRKTQLLTISSKANRIKSHTVTLWALWYGKLTKPNGESQTVQSSHLHLTHLFIGFSGYVMCVPSTLPEESIPSYSNHSLML